MKIPILFIVFTLFTLIACSDNKVKRSHRPLIPKDTTNKLERANSLIVFVGKKISLKQLPNDGSIDNAFLAKYEILENVYGEFQGDTIEFRVFDHYGIPPFSKFDNVLLYVSKDDTFYYHEKYMYNDVYKTKDGRWAGPYTSDYNNQVDKTTGIKPVKLDFKYDVFYLLKEDDAGNNVFYPAPYFETKNGKVEVIYGNYIEDLFKLKKNGVLTYRGLFGDTIPKIPIVKIKSVTLKKR